MHWPPQITMNCIVATSAAGSEEGAVDLPGAEARSKAPDVLERRFCAVGIGGIGMKGRHSRMLIGGTSYFPAINPGTYLDT